MKTHLLLVELKAVWSSKAWHLAVLVRQASWLSKNKILRLSAEFSPGRSKRNDWSHFHISVMELVIWMQINLSGILSGSLQRPRMEQGTLEDWEGLVLGNVGGEQRGSASAPALSPYVLWYCWHHAKNISLLWHALGPVPMPLIPVPSFHWKSKTPWLSLCEEEKPCFIQVSFPQSRDCQAFMPR